MLSAMAKRIAYLKAQADRDPLRYWCWTPPQKQYIESTNFLRIMIGGNQVGKTAASCGLLLYMCLGRHPTIKGHIKEAWLVTHSHEQSRTIQQKLWDLTPKEAVHPSVEFVRGRGFRGLAPILRFKDEYGGAIIRIKTAGQGLGLESASIGLCVIDEPIPAHTFNGLLSRTLRGGPNGSRGYLALSMTPVGNVDVHYLKEMIEKDKIEVIRAPLTVEATTPIGLKPLLTQQQIDSITSKFLPIDRAARIYGSFDVAPIGVIFDNFSDEMITSQPVPNGGEYRFCIGIDHGSSPNSQVCVLSCIDTRDPNQPRVYVLDEYVSGQAPPETHCLAILEMLQRNSIKPELCKWTGDGAYHASRNRQGFKMSNILLMRAFEKILNYPPRNLPFTIRRPIKWRHSVFFGASLIHSIMSRRHFFIHPKCKRTIESIKYWTMKRTQSARSTDPYGHCIDALRYGITASIDTRANSNQKIRIV